jgi:tetratricopeptide (TPR) repeat protein
MLGKLVLSICAAALCLVAANPKVAEAEAKAKAGKFDEAVAILAPLHKSAPKDAEVAKSLTAVYIRYGDSFMYNESLPPRQKYAPALRQYRAALAIDASNKDAQTKIKLIEGIYQQMGRPIPQ